MAWETFTIVKGELVIRVRDFDFCLKKLLKLPALGWLTFAL